jgi:hypothetical protein
VTSSSSSFSGWSIGSTGTVDETTRFGSLLDLA